MSVKQWYMALMDNMLSAPKDTQSSPTPLAPCRVESKFPDLDWPNTWRLARLRGLDSDQITFLWRLLHGLLPLRARLHHITPNTSPVCQLCVDNGLGDQVEDTKHAFFTCTANREAGEALLMAARSILPHLSTDQLVMLDMRPEDSMELPIVWIISKSMQFIWSKRKNKLNTTVANMKAHLSSQI